MIVKDDADALSRHIVLGNEVDDGNGDVVHVDFWSIVVSEEEGHIAWENSGESVHVAREGNNGPAILQTC